MTDLVEALRLEGDRRVCEKEMTFGNSKSREDRVADDLCYQAASRISQQDAELERVRRELETLKAGIKRLSDEEELISETGGDEALTGVHLAARLAEAEELARVMEAESNQMREVSISNRHRAKAAEAKLAEARKAAFIEAAEIAEETIVPNSSGAALGANLRAERIAAALRAKAEETNR